MKEKQLKAADIAKLSGLTENEIRTVTEEFHDIVPCRKLGRVNLYEQNAVSKISDIVRMRNQGLSKDGIYEKFGKKPDKKSTHEKVRERVRKEGSGLPKKSRQPDNPEKPPKISPGAENYTKTNSDRFRRLAESGRERMSGNNTDQIAAQALRTDRVILRIEKLESDISGLKARMEDDRRIIRSHFEAIEKKFDIVSEWIEFFDGDREKIRDGIEGSHLSRKYEFERVRKMTDESLLNHEDELKKVKKEIEILKLPWLKRRKYL
ncbi:MerR family transcriptional regulator [Methanoplanus limicola]|uniref:Uncharacterized protein n=1 Tax=Methanoplanus limicola DSM 2279 TaxID=937775 RepID=H1Z0N9_9EURY|nr:MerR family transcriptional regulator [Methanoplanus limicola]EHQ35296.1 hypothetical protein Metlim_1185 [Methanoplanus limicola DSM 2279]